MQIVPDWQSLVETRLRSLEPGETGGTVDEKTEEGAVVRHLLVSDLIKRQSNVESERERIFVAACVYITITGITVDLCPSILQPRTFLDSYI